MEETVKNAKGVYNSELEKLKEKTRNLKDTFTNQLNQLTVDTNQVLKIGATALGIAVGGYIIYKLVSGGNGKKKDRNTNHADNQIVSKRSGGLDIVEMIKGAIASFILGIAREKIISYIEKVNQKSDEASASTEPVAPKKGTGA